jgi:hypothetical protein
MQLPLFSNLWYIKVEHCAILQQQAGRLGRLGRNETFPVEQGRVYKKTTGIVNSFQEF